MCPFLKVASSNANQLQLHFCPCLRKRIFSLFQKCRSERASLEPRHLLLFVSKMELVDLLQTFSVKFSCQKQSLVLNGEKLNLSQQTVPDVLMADPRKCHTPVTQPRLTLFFCLIPLFLSLSFSHSHSVFLPHHHCN